MYLFYNRMEGPYLSNISIRKFNKKDLLNLKNGITKLDKNEYLEILKILKRNGNKVTENKNGIFINLNNISNEILTEIDNFVKYSFDNHSRLKNLEDLSERLFKDTLSSNKYDKYDISNIEQCNIVNNNIEDGYNLEKTEVKYNMKEDTKPLENDEDEIDIDEDTDELDTDDDDDDEVTLDDIKKIKNMQTLNSEMINDIISNTEESCDIDNTHIDLSRITKKFQSEGDDEDDEDDEDVELNECNIQNFKTGSYTDDISIDDTSIKKTKFVGRNARIIKKCKEINRNSNFDLVMYDGLNNDSMSIEDDEEDEDKITNFKDTDNTNGMNELVEDILIIEK